MGLLSIFKSRVDAGAAGANVGEPVDAVESARKRARQRLIGAVVLVITGVVVFPRVFETQPRPIPVDIPIEIPRKEGAPALVMPPARLPPVAGSTTVTPAAAGTAGAGAGAASNPSARPSPPIGAAPAAPPTAAPAAASAPQAASVRDHDTVITELREEAGRSVSVAGLAGTVPHSNRGLPASAPPPPHRAASVPVVPKAGSTVVAAVKPAAPVHAAIGDGARAKALLEGSDVAPPSAMRFVVQIGAFADGGAARETRLKVDKLGLKTYTQSVQTPLGARIRVRVGPFVTRDEALKAQGRARSAGLSAVVLAL